MRQSAVLNMLVRKFSFAPIEAKIQLFKSYCYPIYGCALWCHQASYKRPQIHQIESGICDELN